MLKPEIQKNSPWTDVLYGQAYYPTQIFLKDEVKVDDYGFIIVDSNMQSSVPGVFAAGDARSTGLRQIVTAAGDAASAVFSAEHYIESIKY